jgi:predicted type IV restriction endonuclease
MEDWKNDRAEAEMKSHEAEMMKKAVEAREKKENEQWNKIKESLYVGSKTEDDSIDWVINNLRKKYELPIEIKK